jgi:hypothetical protein
MLASITRGPVPASLDTALETFMPSPSHASDHQDEAAVRLVLVQHNTVVQTFAPDDGGHAHRTAEMVALATGQPVSIYEVDGAQRLTVGSTVDPRAAGWSELEQEPS